MYKQFLKFENESYKSKEFQNLVEYINIIEDDNTFYYIYDMYQDFL